MIEFFWQLVVLIKLGFKARSAAIAFDHTNAHSLPLTICLFTSPFWSHILILLARDFISVWMLIVTSRFGGQCVF